MKTSDCPSWCPVNDLSDLAKTLMHDIKTLTPDEKEHLLVFLCGYTPAGVQAALDSVERSRALRAEMGGEVR